MRNVLPRPMSFEVRLIAGDAAGTRWHWMVYDGLDGCFVRNGKVSGGRDEAECAARSAIAFMGGRLVSDDEGG